MSRYGIRRYGVRRRSAKAEYRPGSPDFQLLAGVYLHRYELAPSERALVQQLWDVKPRLIAMTADQRAVVQELSERVSK